jgi:hypothetical protein
VSYISFADIFAMASQIIVILCEVCKRCWRTTFIEEKFLLYGFMKAMIGKKHEYS